MENPFALTTIRLDDVMLGRQSRVAAPVRAVIHCAPVGFKPIPKHI